jgi:hypothetical protein
VKRKTALIRCFYAIPDESRYEHFSLELLRARLCGNGIRGWDRRLAAGVSEVSSFLIAAIVFVCLCAATALGMFVRDRLPDHHLSSESKDVIRLATAVVGTLSALALGLLVASAKSSLEDANAEMRLSVARVILLDRVMAHYGPETREARATLRTLVEKRLREGWSAAVTDNPSAGPSDGFEDFEAVQNTLRALTPETEPQRLVKARALEVSGDVAQAHWMLVQTGSEGLPWAFMVILVFWLCLLFTTFGLQAPNNATVISITVVCALSVAGAIFVIVDMANPYLGWIHVSTDPLRVALSQLGQP